MQEGAESEFWGQLAIILLLALGYASWLKSLHIDLVYICVFVLSLDDFLSSLSFHPFTLAYLAHLNDEYIKLCKSAFHICNYI